MPTPIRKIQRLAASLQGEAPRNPADDAWLGTALQTYLGGADLDQAMGLALARGQSDPRRDLMREARDAALAAAADRLLPAGEVWEQARLLHHHLSKFAAGRWRFDRIRKASPYRPDTVEHLFFEALSRIDHVPVEGSLKRIIRSTK
jgi:hypothetical protein